MWFDGWSYKTEIVDPKSGYRRTKFKVPNSATRKEFELSYHAGSVINELVDIAILGLESLTKESSNAVRSEEEPKAAAENPQG